MKLSEIKQLFYKSGQPLSENTDDFFKKLHQITGEYYGYLEVEMDSDFVDVQMQKSTKIDSISIHSHSFYEILFVQNGQLQYLIRNTRYQLIPNDIIIIPPDTPHCPLFLEDLKSPYIRTLMWVTVSFYDFLKKTLSDPPNSLPYLVRLEGHPLSQIKFLIEQIHNEYNHQYLGNELMISSIFGQIFTLINRSIYSNRKFSPKPEQNELIDDIMLYIQDHIADQITLEIVASHFNVSQSYLSKLFNRLMDNSFYRTVIQRRLIESKNLIISGLPLYEVAQKVGFNDYSSFFRSFKNEYGISPKNFLSR